MVRWYEDTPTIIACNGVTTYINFDADRLKEMLPKEAAGTALHHHADVDVTYNPRRNWLG